MSYSTTQPSRGTELEGVDFHGPVYFLQIPGSNLSGVRFCYTFTSEEDAMALYEGSVTMYPRTEVRPITEHLQDIHTREREEWVFPFVRFRSVVGTTVTFTLDRNPLPHGLDYLKKAIHKHLKEVLAAPARLIEAREGNNGSLLSWCKPPLEPYQHAFGQPLEPVSPVLKGLWAAQRIKDRQI